MMVSLWDGFEMMTKSYHNFQLSIINFQFPKIRLDRKEE